MNPDSLKPTPANPGQSRREAAGFILFRTTKKGKRRFLLLRNARRKDWGLAKGHRDKDDANLEETALRELAEETGISEIDVMPDFCHEIEYDVNDRPGTKPYRKRVTYFLASCATKSVRLSREHDSFRWMSGAKALENLKIPSLRDCMKTAVKFLDKNVPKDA